MKKYIISFVLVGVVFVVGGCGGDKTQTTRTTKEKTPLETQEYGGVLRSSDQGRTFLPRSIIATGGTLARMNILSLVIDPSSPRTLYVGTEKNGIFVSKNAGESWERLNFAPQYTSVLVLNPRHTQTIYASAVWDRRGRLFRSDDGGENWKDIYIEPTEGTLVTAVVLAPDDPQTIYIGTSGGNQNNATLARSTDGGATWENLYSTSRAITHLAFDAVDVNTIYAYSKDQAVIRSRDRGAHWEDLSDLERDDDTMHYFTGQVHSFAAHPHRAGVLYVGTDDGLFRSDDYGLSWNEEKIIASSKGLPIFGLALAPQGDGLVYVAGKAVYVRSGERDVWAITDTRSDKDVVVVAYDPQDPRVIYMGLRTLKKPGLLGF